MPAISSLIQRLVADYPQITFVEGATPHWSVQQRTVTYNPHEPHSDWVVLHETAHALLGHDEYTKDIMLLKMERQAWDYATAYIAPRYEIEIDAAFIETQLDTYRDWLHAKSTCPACQSTGLEYSKHSYQCIHCGNSWHTNIGIETGIRRYVFSTY